MILIDLTQIVVGLIHGYEGDEFKKSSNHEEVSDLIRHLFFNNLLFLKKKFEKEYGNVVLCCDSKTYWRKEKYPWYKGHRKFDREKSAYNWELIYSAISELKQNINECFNYKMVETHGAEADDVIACLSKYFQTNDLIQNGLYEDQQKILIISSDQDFCQLQKYKNVFQYSPMHKKLIHPDKPVDKFLIEHIVG